MNQTEIDILQKCNEELVRVLDARHIAPLLYSKGYLSIETMEELFEQSGPRRNICQRFLLSIVKSCPFDVFLDVLYCKNYGVLVQTLKDMKDSKDNIAQIEASKGCPTNFNQSTSISAENHQYTYDKGIENTCHSIQRLQTLKRYADVNVQRMEDLKMHAYTDNHTSREIENRAYHKIKDLKVCDGDNSDSLNYDLKSYADPSVHRSELYNDSYQTRGTSITEHVSRNSVSVGHESENSFPKVDQYSTENMKYERGLYTKPRVLKDMKYERTESSVCPKDTIDHLSEHFEYSRDTNIPCMQNLNIYTDTSDFQFEELKCYTDASICSYNTENSTSHAYTSEQRLKPLKVFEETNSCNMQKDLKCTQESTTDPVEGKDVYIESNSDKRMENFKDYYDSGVHQLKGVTHAQGTRNASLEYPNFCPDFTWQRLENLKHCENISVPTRAIHKSSNNGADQHDFCNSNTSFETKSHGPDEMNCSLSKFTPRHESYIDLKAKKLENLKCSQDSDILYCQDNQGPDVPTMNTVKASAVQDNITLPKPVPRITCRDSSHMRKVTILAHKLKTLSHDGNVEKLREITAALLDRFRNNKSKLNVSVNLKMKEADVAFTALEAEASAKRVKYDVTLYESDVFKEMESVIPFTSNPTCSSMTYLARYGSAVSMMESLDTGIAHLMYAKHHAQHIEPGKPTGMVYYIEVNLLFQKYEQNPDPRLKERILRTAEEAISHFTHEVDDIRRDYQRMLMLKMAFCYLGIGLFCRSIENVSNSQDDRMAAKSCLDFIERPENWTGMEKRRKMLFMVAKAEIYRQEKQNDLARCHAVEARKLALEGDWKTELSNIEKLLEVTDNPESTGLNNDEINIDDIINELLDDDN